MATGQLDRAAAQFAQATAAGPLDDCEKTAQAVLFIRRGHLGQAIWNLCRTTSARGGRCKGVHAKRVYVLAYAYAIGGDLKEADRLSPRELQHSNSPLHLLLLCKRRRFFELSSLAVSRELRMRLPAFRSAFTTSPLGSHGKRVAALLSAFAFQMEERVSATNHRHPSARLTHHLEAARPTCSDEYDYLQHDWPELRAFLEDHQDFLGTWVGGRTPTPPPKASVVKDFPLPFSNRASGTNL